MKFEKGNNYGKGRPLGSKNKTANQEKLIIFIDKILDSMELELESLTIDQRIKILSAYKDAFGLTKIMEINEDNTPRVVTIDMSTWE